MDKMRIESCGAARIAGMVHQGPYLDISRTFQKFLDAHGGDDGLDRSRGMVAVFFDDPKTTPANDLRSLAGMFLLPDATAPESLETCDFPAGRYAVLTQEGPYDGLAAVYEWLYGTWLPGSGESALPLPPFERYLKTPPDAAPEGYVTEVYVALS